MQLTLEQAAEILGKSRRQVGYLIKTGKLKATKVGGRWRIDDQDLPASPGRDAATARKQAQLVAAVEDTLEVPARSQRRRYSIQNLRAFQIASPLYRQTKTTLGPEHPACAALHRALAQLARGCHRYAHADKATAYLAARDAASDAACELALTEHADAPAYLECIEQELMAAIAGLIRRIDRLMRRKRDMA